MQKLFKYSVVILTIAYPFIVYYSLGNIDEKWLLLFLLSLLVMRWFVAKKITNNSMIESKAVLLSVVGISLIIWMKGESVGLKFYPVIVSGGLLLLFAASLFAEQSIVERLARLQDKNLSKNAIKYTKKVTVCWCAFFIINASIATYIALWENDEVWVLYNGLISYVLMGTLAAGEWIVRQKFKKKDALL